MGDGLPPDLVQLRSTLPIRALVLGLILLIVDQIFNLLNLLFLDEFLRVGVGVRVKDRLRD